MAVADLDVHASRAPSLAAFVGYFLRLGTFGFGGPIALAGAMQRDLVEDRGWVSKDEYVKGLALAQLAPGPLAAQLAIYLGWAKAGLFGATLVAIAFVLPSFLMVIAISVAYVRFGGLAWMQSAFYGIGAAVIAIILRSASKLVRLTLGRNRLLWAIFVANAIATAMLEAEVLSLIVGCGVATLAVQLWKSRGRRAFYCAADCIRGIEQRDSRDRRNAVLVLRQGGRVRLRQRSGDRAVSLRRRRARAWMADRSAVSRCCRRGHDHAWPGSHHRRLHRLSRAGLQRRRARSARRLPAVLSLRRCPGTVLCAVRRQRAIESVRRRCHCRRDGRDRRRGLRPRTPRDHRRSDHSDFRRNARVPGMAQARARAGRDRDRRDCVGIVARRFARRSRRCTARTGWRSPASRSRRRPAR
jgi:chromate transport protein ChrA